MRWIHIAIHAHTSIWLCIYIYTWIRTCKVITTTVHSKGWWNLKSLGGAFFSAIGSPKNLSVNAEQLRNYQDGVASGNLTQLWELILASREINSFFICKWTILFIHFPLRYVTLPEGKVKKNIYLKDQEPEEWWPKMVQDENLETGNTYGGFHKWGYPQMDGF